MTWLRLFLLGWRQRSATILDSAGAPLWLVRWRCSLMRGWGTMLNELVDAMVSNAIWKAGPAYGTRKDERWEARAIGEDGLPATEPYEITVQTGEDFLRKHLPPKRFREYMTDFVGRRYMP